MTTETNAWCVPVFPALRCRRRTDEVKMSFYWERLFPGQHCDSAKGWSHAPVRISWRGSASDRVCRDTARAQKLGDYLVECGRKFCSKLCNLVTSGHLPRACLHRKTTWLLDRVWGIEVWKMHLLCTVLYLISYVFITQWVCGQIPKLYNLMQSHIYKKACLHWQRNNPALQELDAASPTINSLFCSVFPH